MKNEWTLLTFALDQVCYAFPVHEVREVVPLPELTPLVDAPPFVSGIFNLRGKIVTAINLRQRLGLECRPWNVKNAVLVALFEEKTYGLIVDEALSLIKLPQDDIGPAPDLSSFMGTHQGQLVLGVGESEGRLIPILNLNRIFTMSETQGLYGPQETDDGKSSNPRA